MEHKQEIEIEKIMAEMKCPHNFQCHKHRFEELCKIVDYLKSEKHVQCIEEEGGNPQVCKPQSCTFSIIYPGERICRCPLRVYLFKNLSI
jgi:hypothetical protein